MSIYRHHKAIGPRNDHAADQVINWDCLDEFEKLQMLCSYEYGEWNNEDNTRDEYA